MTTLRSRTAVGSDAERSDGSKVDKKRLLTKVDVVVIIIKVGDRQGDGVFLGAIGWLFEQGRKWSQWFLEDGGKVTKVVTALEESVSAFG